MINIHPLLVHFPIAFLVLYSFLELISIKKISNKIWLLNTKAILVIVGFISGLIASSSSQVLKHDFSQFNNLREVYIFWIRTTNVIFGIIAILYLIKIFSVNNIFNFKTESFLNKVWSIKQKITNYILSNRLILTLIVIAGFVSIIITGSLRASIEYGAINDPMVEFIYSNLINYKKP